jgi:hypothetical protein
MVNFNLRIAGIHASGTNLPTGIAFTMMALWGIVILLAAWWGDYLLCSLVPNYAEIPLSYIVSLFAFVGLGIVIQGGLLAAMFIAQIVLWIL